MRSEQQTESPIHSAEVVVWVITSRRLTSSELGRICKAAEAVVDEPVVRPFASYYHDDGTKS